MASSANTVSRSIHGIGIDSALMIAWRDFSYIYNIIMSYQCVIFYRFKLTK
jgi:hypothetical protein